jgi:hypothetical protein
MNKNKKKLNKLYVKKKKFKVLNYVNISAGVTAFEITLPIKFSLCKNS